MLGMLLFSGGLFAFVLTDVRWLVHVVPLGGAAFLLGWLVLAISAARTRE